MDYNYKTHGDFKKYYDPKLKRNIWVLGYFGGGSVNISDALEIATDYADATHVPLNTIQIDEILYSRRFKGFKFIYSINSQAKEQDAEEMQDVYSWLRD